VAQTTRLPSAAAWTALFVIFGLLAVWARRTEEIYTHGEGSLGLDSTRWGPRVSWADVTIPPAPSTIDAAKGAALYQQWCLQCHGEQGAGDGVLAKALSPPPRNFTKARFRFRTTPEGSLPSDADLFRTLTSGVLPSRMPGFAFLSDAERWALVSHVKKLTKYFDEDEKKDIHYFELLPPEPEAALAKVPAADAQAVARGMKLFQERGECWKCHGLEGRGDGPSAETLVAEEGNRIWPGNLRRGPAFFKTTRNAQDVFRILKLGIVGTPMPSYASSLKENELMDIAIFTESLWLQSARPTRTLEASGTKILSEEQQRVAVGEQSFLANCSGCHGKLGRGDGPAAKWLNPRPASLATGVYKRKSTPEGCFPSVDDLKSVLREGIPGSSMPAWNLHGDAELSALVSYLQDLSGFRSRQGEPIPIPNPPKARIATKEAVTHGAQLFAANCAMCHGEAAAGDGAWSSIVTDYRGEKLRPRNLREEPMKAGATAPSLFRTVSYGFEGTPMPGFAESLTEADRWDLVAFVLSLRTPAAVALGGSK